MSWPSTTTVPPNRRTIGSTLLRTKTQRFWDATASEDGLRTHSNGSTTRSVSSSSSAWRPSVSRWPSTFSSESPYRRSSDALDSRVVSRPRCCLRTKAAAPVLLVVWYLGTRARNEFRSGNLENICQPDRNISAEVEICGGELGRRNSKQDRYIGVFVVAELLMDCEAVQLNVFGITYINDSMSYTDASFYNRRVASVGLKMTIRISEIMPKRFLQTAHYHFSVY